MAGADPAIQEIINNLDLSTLKPAAERSGTPANALARQPTPTGLAKAPMPSRIHNIKVQRQI